MPRRRTVPLPRGPGRPSAETADHRQRLLDAALRCFVGAGIAATSLREVAKQAGVTPALVHYYFGSKEQLVAAVFAERLQPVFEELRAQLGTVVAGNLVSGLVAGVHRTVERHPWLPALWVREILTEGGALREGMLTRVAPNLAPVLAKRFAELQRAGGLNPDLDPRLLVVSIIGLTLFPLAAEGIWRRVFPDAGLDHSVLRQHTLALFDAGLENRDARA